MEAGDLPHPPLCLLPAFDQRFFSALPLLLTVLLLLHNCQRRRAMTNRSPCWLIDLLSAEPLNIGCSSKRPHLNPLLPIVSVYSDLNRKAPGLQLTPTK